MQMHVSDINLRSLKYHQNMIVNMVHRKYDDVFVAYNIVIDQIMYV